MKKVIVIMVLICFLLASVTLIAGCSKDDGKKGTSIKKSSDKTKIKVPTKKKGGVKKGKKKAAGLKKK